MLLNFIKKNLLTKKRKRNQLLRFQKTIARLLTTLVSVLVVIIGALFNRALKMGIDVTALNLTEKIVLISISILFCSIVFFVWLSNHVIEKKLEKLQEDCEEINHFLQQKGTL